MLEKIFVVPMLLDDEDESEWGGNQSEVSTEHGGASMPSPYNKPDATP